MRDDIGLASIRHQGFELNVGLVPERDPISGKIFAVPSPVSDPPHLVACLGKLPGHVPPDKPVRPRH